MTSELQCLSSLHLEISSKCRLACPACPRTYRKGEYAVTELPISVVERIVSSQPKFESVILCGDHGDPIYHTQFHELVELLQKLPGEPRICIATNGSYRSQEWWGKAAALLRPQDEVIFGVDGLWDTSLIYRRNSDWDSIMLGMRTLKQKSRCILSWQWILFQFNQNQLEEAARLSRELAVDHFQIIGSSRHSEVDPWRPTISLQEAQERFQNAYLSQV